MGFWGFGDKNGVDNSDNDTVTYVSATNAITVDLENGTATGEGSDSLSGIENAIGSNYDDTFKSNFTSDNIFDGGSTKTNVTNAKIALENQKILLDQQKVTIENNLKNTWENYNNQLFVLKAQEKNVLTTQNNFDRTTERYKLGQVTSIEFRQAQINLINSKTAFNNAKFDAKLIELQLLQLSGDILNIKF